MAGKAAAAGAGVLLVTANVGSLFDDPCQQDMAVDPDVQPDKAEWWHLAVEQPGLCVPFFIYCCEKGFWFENPSLLLVFYFCTGG
ncbi:hypothetical protein BTVI_159096 [Pitangus sulphuratus]|nr:hypothetical protein BTVI_159096 [Pitangus sulphuratus]